MNKLNIEAFKVFEKPIEIRMDGKNILLYGENGSGKSSLFEAIKIIFLRDLIEKRKIPNTVTPEDEQQMKNDLYDSYNNSKNSTLPFKLEVNDVDYLNFDLSNYQVFMISPEMLSIESTISLKEILINGWFKIDDIDTFINDYQEAIAEEVSRQMNEIFKENIILTFDDAEDFKCILFDPRRDLTRKIELNSYFNEAKLHLIKLLITFNIIHLSINKDDNVKKILILDDFITSLDAANRTFLTQYILDNFKKVQKIILTHNVSFYNLVRYIIHRINIEENKWDFLNLYLIETSAHICQHSLDKTVESIKKYYESTGSNIEQTGNLIRKKFEILLYELSKLLQIGTFEECSHIIELLARDEPIYFSSPNKTVNNLIKEIKAILSIPNLQDTKQKLEAKINEYEKSDFKNLKKIIKDLTLYQKVALHPMSHGITGLIPFTHKEIAESLVLLEKLEKCISKFQDKNVISI